MSEYPGKKGFEQIVKNNNIAQFQTWATLQFRW